MFRHFQSRVFVRGGRCKDRVQTIAPFKVRLHTTINRAYFVSWCMLYTYEGNKMCIIRIHLITFICTVYTARICRAAPKNSGTRIKILAVPCPKRYSVNGVYVWFIIWLRWEFICGHFTFLILFQGHDLSADYWSLGILMYELLTGR